MAGELSGNYFMVSGRPAADGRLILAAHLASLITAELTTGLPPAELAPYRPDRFTV
jgi:hypothetical protein